jgi:membrane-associated phospholipid phosphatase
MHTIAKAWLAMAVFASIFTATMRADEVTEWNQTMLRAGLVAQTTPLQITRVAAIVQAAMFDAINGIDRRYTPILVSPAAPPNASRRAAAVQAAWGALSHLYGTLGVSTPTTLQVAQQATLDARLRVSLTIVGVQENQASIESGIAWGQTVAEQIWALRKNDLANPSNLSFTGDAAAGDWRPTPNAPVSETSTSGPMAGYPQFVFMTPWAIQTDSQFRPGGPPALTSSRYAQDFNETKTMGSYSSTARTADQTIYSLFWVVSSTYAFNGAAVSLIEDRDREEVAGRDRDDTLLENARLLASLDVAMADAAIGCWDAKYYYHFWRPITAIREAASDGNPLTTPDPNWAPMFATPAHPDYPSGHSCVSGAAAVVLTNEFGDKTRFTLESDLMLGVVRSYRSFSAALEEVKNARVFAGIHFRSATEDGVKLGADVAHYVLENKFQRIH